MMRAAAIVITSCALALGGPARAQESGAPCASATTDEARLKCLELLQRECSGIADQALRLACYDRVLGAATKAPAVSASLPQPAPPDAADFSKWKQSRAGDGPDGVVLSLDAEEEVRDWRGRNARPTLSLTCAGGRVDARVRTGTAVQPEAEDTRTVSLAWDGGAPAVEQMRPSDDEKELLFGDAAATLGRLRAHRVLSFQFTPFRAERVAIEFRVVGLGPLLDPVAAACGITALPPREGQTEPVATTVAVATVLVEPVLLPGSNKPPEYPTRARTHAIDGDVDVAVRILPDGSVGDVTVLRCSRPGFGFESAAVSAVKRWKYRPATQNGEPVEYLLTVPIHFKYQ